MNTKKFITVIVAFLFALVTVSYAQKPDAPIPQEPPAQAETHFAGVGVMLAPSIENGRIFIVTLLSDSPAAKAGLKPNSTLISINGESTANLTVKHCAELIRGEAGIQVTLGLVDPKTQQTNTVTLTRATISLPPAKR